MKTTMLCNQYESKPNRSGWFQEQLDWINADPDRKAESIAARLMHSITGIFYARMEELGLTQTELANLIGTTQPTLSRLFNRGTNMTLKTFAALSEALKLEVRAPAIFPKSYTALVTPAEKRTTSVSISSGSQGTECNTESKDDEFCSAA
ncbi:MAG: helix-turn-helix transcriptional regulator [Candidatus Electryoneaceae bacterium]|nr:helix-turn-helix transcriptional regulator [Candidatus Electryoneaceae bacterium]